MDRFDMLDNINYWQDCRARGDNIRDEEIPEGSFIQKYPNVKCLATRLAPRDLTGRDEPVYDLFTPTQCAACDGPAEQGKPGPLYQCIPLWYGCSKPRAGLDYVTFYIDPTETSGAPRYKGRPYNPVFDGTVSECGSCSMCLPLNSARHILNYEVELMQNQDVAAIKDAYEDPRMEASLPPYVCVPSAWAGSFLER